MYYLCSEIKGADQLHCYREVTAKLICVFVFAYAKKSVFITMRLNYIAVYQASLSQVTGNINNTTIYQLWLGLQLIATSCTTQYGQYLLDQQQGKGRDFKWYSLCNMHINFKKYFCSKLCLICSLFEPFRLSGVLHKYYSNL